MTAYYNEHDPYAAQWLRNLIAAGHIAPGIVDERDIRDIKPEELTDFVQCHFFAGIGVWSHALRRAGWSDDRPVWTGSCPCQPFSAAGGRRGTADERHLWPHWFHLVDQCRPPVVLGEQVASKDGLGWLDLVSDDLEGADYAFAASDLCAAGFSGAHIRQRLYFVGLANSNDERHQSLLRSRVGATDTNGRNRGPFLGLEFGNTNIGLALPHSRERQRLADGEGRLTDRKAPGRIESDGIAEPSGDVRGVDNTASARRDGPIAGPEGTARDEARMRLSGERCGQDATRPTHAPMLGRHPADWLFCRDGKWRPVEPGTFPLADAASSRVGRLRAYGNGLDAETATGFVASVMEVM